MITLTAQSALPTRFHPRVDAGFMVKLFTGGRSVLAKATDLSMAGLKLVGDFAAADDRMTLCIPIPGDREVVTQATVRRRNEEGLAVEFDQLDWDDMFAIARYLHPRLP
ncbi:MAG: PilZ domain-containing protein [Myxococcaceae bacterium]